MAGEPTTSGFRAAADMLGQLWNATVKRYQEQGPVKQGAKDVGYGLGSVLTGLASLPVRALPGDVLESSNPLQKRLAPLVRADDYAYSQMSPAAQAAGMVTDPTDLRRLSPAALLPAIAKGKSARTTALFHGTTPERAKRLLKEGFMSGQSALLGVQGTSLSRDPNVSLHRFAYGDPEGLLAVEMPDWLARQVHNMTPEDFVNTARLLKERPDIPLYNKPSSLYKELETFVRREHIEEPGGQLSLLRPTDYLKARRPTPEEMEFATRVTAKVRDAYGEANLNEWRAMAHFRADRLDRAQATTKGGARYSTQALLGRGPPSPDDILRNFNAFVGSGSNTERAKALSSHGGPMSPLNHMPLIVYDDQVHVTGMADGVGVILTPKGPRLQYDITGDKSGEQVMTRWWNSQSPVARHVLRQWGTPKGKAVLDAGVHDKSGSMLYTGKLNLEAGASVQEGAARGAYPGGIQVYKSSSGQWGVQLWDFRTAAKHGSKAELKHHYIDIDPQNTPGAKLYTSAGPHKDRTEVWFVPANSLAGALSSSGNRLVKEGIQKREATFRKLEKLR